MMGRNLIAFDLLNFSTKSVQKMTNFWTLFFGSNFCENCSISCIQTCNKIYVQLEIGNDELWNNLLLVS